MNHQPPTMHMHTFICNNCQKEVMTSGNIGTHQRNHCPFCLFSKHVDNMPGDRKAVCHGLMVPLGLTFKKEKEGKLGEIMLIHACRVCGKISINRIAGDDDPDEIMGVFEASWELPQETKEKLKIQDILLADQTTEREIEVQLFGN